jgi:hypothetical protein
MAFREKIVPNWRGAPRELEPVEHERRDPSPQLTPAQHERAYRYARLHRVSLAEAVRQLYDNDE